MDGIYIIDVERLEDGIINVQILRKFESRIGLFGRSCNGIAYSKRQSPEQDGSQKYFLSIICL